MPASRSRSPVPTEEAPQGAACRQGLRLLSMPRGLEEEEHTPRIARRGIESSEKLGRLQVGRRTNPVVDEPQPGAEGTLRAAR